MGELIKHNASQIQKLSVHEKNICEVLVTFNQLRDFKLIPEEILEWKDTLLRLSPKLDPVKLSFVVDKLIVGELPYEKGAGIRNLVDGLKRVEKIDGKFRIKGDFTW